MDPTSYERAVSEYLRLHFPEPMFVVRHNVMVPGKRSGEARQTDIGVFSPPDPAPIFIAEAKRHRRMVDLASAGMVISLVRDIGPVPSVLVATAGFSAAAKRYLAHEGIEHLVITIERAECLGWVSDLRARFHGEAEFMEVSGSLVEAIRNADPTSFLECDLPYEEWLAVADLGLSKFAKNAATVFMAIAREHHDDGHRFNAIQVLDNWNLLSSTEAASLMESETDPDVRELLLEVRSYQIHSRIAHRCSRTPGHGSASPSPPVGEGGSAEGRDG